MPDWPRIHVTSLANTSVVTNIRSSSERWARYRIAARGLPSGVNSNDCGSSGAPSPQAAKAGEAISAFSFSASSVRSFGGKNASISKTPSLRSGGDWIWPISPPRSRSWPERQAFSIRFERRTCSRLESGSVAIPTRPRRLVTVPSISSRSVSASASHESAGARNEPITFNGTPAEEPGVYSVTSAASFNCWIRSGPIPWPPRPSRQLVAVFSASASTVMPSACASDAFTHGSKLAGARSGNVSARLPMSPFGSTISTGMPASSASSSRTTARPVLPEPVMPTTTPWVVRSPEPMTRSSVPGLPVTGSMILPR